MTAPIEIPVVLKGLPEAKNAIKSLHDMLVKLETEATKSASSESKKRTKIFQDEAKLREKIAKSVDEDMDRAIGGGSRRSLGNQKTAVTSPSFAGGGGNIDLGGLAKMASFAGAVGLALGILKGGLDLAVEGLKQFGSFLISDIVKPQFELETFATQLENSTNGQVKAQQLMDVANSQQAKWNVNAMEAAKAVSDLTDATGDAPMAMEMIDTFSQLNKGFGVDMQQLSGLTSAMYKEGMSVAQIKQMLGTQLAQGQVTGGKFTLKQISGLGGEFTKSTASLAGNSDFQMAELGAALQTGGIAGKADTSMNNLNKFIEETAGGKLGGNIAQKGIVGDLGDAIRAALVKSGGDASKFKGMGYSDSAIAFIKQYSGKFAEELKKNGGNLNDAAKAATSTLEEMRNAVADENGIKQAANKVMETSGQKWEHAINTIKDKLLDIMPAVTDLVDSLTEHAPELAEAAETLAQILIKVAKALGWFVGLNPEDKTPEGGDIGTGGSGASAAPTSPNAGAGGATGSSADYGNSNEGAEEISQAEFDAIEEAKKAGHAVPYSVTKEYEQPSIGPAAPSGSTYQAPGTIDAQGKVSEGLDKTAESAKKLKEALDKTSESVEGFGDSRTKPINER